MGRWVKSSYSGVGNCVEAMKGVVNGEHMITIRDSERPAMSILTTTECWDAFIAGVKAGEFDNLPDPAPIVSLPPGSLEATPT